MRLLGIFKKAFVAFNKSLSFQSKAFFAIFLLFFGWIGFVIIQELTSEGLKSYRIEHASPAEHLARAKEICNPDAPNAASCLSTRPEALRHLEMIPKSALEYGEASKFLDMVRQQREREAQVMRNAAAAMAAERARNADLENQSQQQSWEQMRRNIEGKAHDNFTCSTSTQDQPIMSFDNGHYWWWDDGRCAPVQAQRKREEQQKRETALRAEQAKHDAEQKQRDADAEYSSYWARTIRVDTDMDSFWLSGEERTCQTYPNENGRVAVVACNNSGTHRERNIPVTFWGGLDRNKVTEWKCQRNKNLLNDEFVCRAIN